MNGMIKLKATPAMNVPNHKTNKFCSQGCLGRKNVDFSEVNKSNSPPQDIFNNYNHNTKQE